MTRIHEENQEDIENSLVGEIATNRHSMIIITWLCSLKQSVIKKVEELRLDDRMITWVGYMISRDSLLRSVSLDSDRHSFILEHKRECFHEIPACLTSWGNEKRRIYGRSEQRTRRDEVTGEEGKKRRWSYETSCWRQQRCVSKIINSGIAN